VVLTPGNFFEGGGFRAKADREKWYTGPIQAEYVLRKGSLIVAMTEQAEGLLGRAHSSLPTTTTFTTNDSGSLKSWEHTGRPYGFVYHLFNSPPVRQQIRGSATGTKVRPPRRLGSEPCEFASPRPRCSAASLKSSRRNDELIENCEQRVFVLEQMASMLYRSGSCSSGTQGVKKCRSWIRRSGGSRGGGVYETRGGPRTAIRQGLEGRCP